MRSTRRAIAVLYPRYAPEAKLHRDAPARLPQQADKAVNARPGTGQAAPRPGITVNSGDSRNGRTSRRRSSSADSDRRPIVLARDGYDACWRCCASAGGGVSALQNSPVFQEPHSIFGRIEPDR